jgi:threonine aldolase
VTTTYVDLRSDTVTQPTPAMRRAMAEAEVGDDVFRGDPTVRRLEEETAALLGKEAALFVPSGSMGNETALAVHTRPGEEILTDRHSHIAEVETAAVTKLLRCGYRILDGDRGRLDPGEVAAALAKDGPPGGARGEGRVSLVETENTNNHGSGAIYPLPQLRAVRAAARARGLPVHLDGARLWNASIAAGVPLADYAATADSLMVCYSKGLGAPVGSAVAGTKAFIDAARDARRMFGGGMRQAGIIAAGALHAVRHHRERLVEDHARARRLAEGLAAVPGIEIDPAEIATNIVIAGVRPAERVDAFVEAMDARGILIFAFGGIGRFRAVTHMDVDDAGLERAIVAAREAAREALAP